MRSDRPTLAGRRTLAGREPNRIAPVRDRHGAVPESPLRSATRDTPEREPPEAGIHAGGGASSDAVQVAQAHSVEGEVAVSGGAGDELVADADADAERDSAVPGSVASAAADGELAAGDAADARAMPVYENERMTPSIGVALSALAATGLRDTLAPSGAAWVLARSWQRRPAESGRSSALAAAPALLVHGGTWKPRLGHEPSLARAARAAPVPASVRSGSGPSLDRPAPAPGPGRDISLPSAARSTQPPYTARNTQPPYTARNTQPPYTERNTQPPYTERNTQPPYTERNTPTPSAGRNMPTPSAGRNTPLPSAGHTPMPPYPGPAAPPPYPARNTPTPYAGRNTPTDPRAAHSGTQAASGNPERAIRLPRFLAKSGGTRAPYPEQEPTSSGSLYAPWRRRIAGARPMWSEADRAAEVTGPSQEPREGRPWLRVAFGFVACLAALLVVRDWVVDHEPASLVLLTEPDDARVVLDDVQFDASHGTFSLKDVAPRISHVLEVRHAGYEPHLEALRLEPGELRILPKVVLRRTPPDAAFAVDRAGVASSHPTSVPPAVIAAPGPQPPVAREAQADAPTARRPLPPQAPAERSTFPNLVRSTGTRDRGASQVLDAAPALTLPNPYVDRPAIVTHGPSGTLRLNSMPWTQVIVDGTEVGTTPQMALQLPVGKHRIKLVNPELVLVRTFDVTIREGETTTRLLELLK